MHSVKRVVGWILQRLALLGKKLIFPFVAVGGLLLRGLGAIKVRHLRWVLPGMALISLLSFLAFLQFGIPWHGMDPGGKEETSDARVTIINGEEAKEAMSGRALEVREEDMDPEAITPILMPPREEDPIPTFTLEDLMAPVLGEVVAPFGWYYHNMFQDWRFHKGIDVKAESGTSVQAVWQGKVKEIREDNLLGTVVKLEHSSDLITVYGHLGQVTVEEGKRIRQGDHLGVVVECPFTQSSHLHFELHRDGIPIDPGPYYRGWRGEQ